MYFKKNERETSESAVSLEINDANNKLKRAHGNCMLRAEKFIENGGEPDN